MRVIAYRKEAIWLLYVFCAIVSIALLIAGSDPIRLIGGSVLLIASVIICIQYFMLPSAIISVDSNNKLYLPKGITLDPKDIVDVSYRRASARSIQYKWGSVTIRTATAKYKYGYIADCESVAKIITDIVYKSKSSDIDIFQ